MDAAGTELKNKSSEADDSIDWKEIVGSVLMIFIGLPAFVAVLIFAAFMLRP